MLTAGSTATLSHPRLITKARGAPRWEKDRVAVDSPALRRPRPPLTPQRSAPPPPLRIPWSPHPPRSLLAIAATTRPSTERPKRALAARSKAKGTPMMGKATLLLRVVGLEGMMMVLTTAASRCTITSRPLESRASTMCRQRPPRPSSSAPPAL